MEKKEIRYTILDPTGNITALVESEVSQQERPGIAAQIMKRHSSVEQVGFVRFFNNEGDGDAGLKSTGPENDGFDASLCMAGGEFCGNASMCAAALFHLRSGSVKTRQDVMLRVSGASGPVPVRLGKLGYGLYSASLQMPPAKGIERISLSSGGLKGELPVVRMEGISHIMIEAGSCFFSLIDRPIEAGQAIKEWCAALSAQGLGLMFLVPIADFEYRMTPLVYIPGSDTLFFEHSCASGSAAACVYFAHEKKEDVTLQLHQPGGVLTVAGGYEGRVQLEGSVRAGEEGTL